MESTPPLSAPLLRVQELRAQGKSLRAIAEILEAEGVPPLGRSKKWNQPGVRACVQQLEALNAPPPVERSAERETPDALTAQIQRLSELTAEQAGLNEEQEKLNTEGRGLLDRWAEEHGQRIDDLGQLIEHEKQQQAQRAKQICGMGEGGVGKSAGVVGNGRWGRVAGRRTGAGPSGRSSSARAVHAWPGCWPGWW